MPVLILTFMVLAWGKAWDTWSWSNQREPMHYYLRTIETIPIKTPSLQCECPPNKECMVQYKINTDMPEFLRLRGVLTNEDFNIFNNNIRRMSQSAANVYNDRGDNEKAAMLRKRRQARDGDTECCCPPRNIMMPTFITDKKFKNLLAGKLRNQYTEDLQYNQINN